MAAPRESQAGGRWVAHVLTQAPVAGTVGLPVDTFSFADTATHWVLVAYFDLSAGQWQYPASPYFYSNGTVDFHVPAFDRWYYVMFYDTVTGAWY